VDLDLSASTVGSHALGSGLYNDGTFDPGTAFAGLEYISSLVLPNAATSIKAGTQTAPTFKNFEYFYYVAGKNVTAVGDYAFYDCNNLAAANFPKVTTIGERAFYDCAISSLNLPEATTIGKDAFRSCRNLATVNLPKAASIGEYAFNDCSSLATLSLPKATTIGEYAFNSCGLTTVSLPEAQTIGNYAFASCSGFQSLNLYTATPPTRGSNIFENISYKTITIHIPTDKLSEYNTEGWIDANNSGTYGGYSITVTIQNDL
jgi:hypothetical protein